jgi:GNAT superfamily N-acetyltransferase
LALSVRRALPRDRKDILRICSQTWPGWGDYVPQFLNRWLREKGFYVLVEKKAGARETVVALGKFTELAPGELWLEGLRVDPASRSHGLGWKLSQATMEHALAEHPKSIRLATGRRNRHSRRIIGKMGLRLKFRFWSRDGRIPRPVKGRKRAAGAQVFIPSAPMAWDYIRRTEEYRAARGLLQNTWQFRTVTPGLLAALARQKRLFAWGKPEDLRGLLIIQPGRYDNGRLDISFIEGRRGALGAFRDVVRRAALGRLWPGGRKFRSISGMAASRVMLRHLGGLDMRPHRRPGHVRWVLVYEYPLT